SVASQFYRKVLTDFPQSALRLQASYLEAYCAFQVKDYLHVVDLLQDPGGAFQQLAKASPGAVPSLRGQLLLADALVTLGRLDGARAALERISPAQDQPEFLWEKNYLLARAELATVAPNGAFPFVSNALAAALTAKKPLLEAQIRNLEADIYRKLGR